MLNVDYEDFDAPTTRCPEERLWIEVLTVVIDDAKAGRKHALVYILESPQFEFLCSALGYNAVSIRERVVPNNFREWLASVRRPPTIRTDKADNTMPKRSKNADYMREYYRKRRRAERAAGEPTKPLAAPAMVPAQVSMPTTFQQALAAAPGEWEDALARVFERRTLDEWEAYCLRFEIEEIIHQQQTNGVSDHAPHHC